MVLLTSVSLRHRFLHELSDGNIRYRRRAFAGIAVEIQFLTTEQIDCPDGPRIIIPTHV